MKESVFVDMYLPYFRGELELPEELGETTIGYQWSTKIATANSREVIIRR